MDRVRYGGREKSAIGEVVLSDSWGLLGGVALIGFVAGLVVSFVTQSFVPLVVGTLLGLLPTLLATRARERSQLDAQREKERSERPNIVACKACGNQVSRTAPSCPRCGQNAPGLHIKCPKCFSMNFTIDARGFGLTNAAIGAVLLGTEGLLGGMVGRKQVEFVCQACGKRWKPTHDELG
jgi:hypothetical protein